MTGNPAAVSADGRKKRKYELFESFLNWSGPLKSKVEKIQLHFIIAHQLSYFEGVIKNVYKNLVIFATFKMNERSFIYNFVPWLE